METVQPMRFHLLRQCRDRSKWRQNVLVRTHTVAIQFEWVDLKYGKMADVRVHDITFLIWNVVFVHMLFKNRLETQKSAYSMFAWFCSKRILCLTEIKQNTRHDYWKSPWGNWSFPVQIRFCWSARSYCNLRFWGGHALSLWTGQSWSCSTGCALHARP